MTDKALLRLVETLVDKGIFSKEDEEYVLDALEDEADKEQFITKEDYTYNKKKHRWGPNNEC